MTTETRERGRVQSEAERITSLETLIAATLPHLATKEDVAPIPHLATKEDVAPIPHMATKEDVAVIPHLATKEDVAPIPHLATKEDVAPIPHLATKAQLEQVRGELLSEIKEAESRLIRWIIGAAIALAAVIVASIALAERLLG